MTYWLLWDTHRDEDDATPRASFKIPSSYPIKLRCVYTGIVPNWRQRTSNISRMCSETIWPRTRRNSRWPSLRKSFLRKMWVEICIFQICVWYDPISAVHSLFCSSRTAVLRGEGVSNLRLWWQRDRLHVRVYRHNAQVRRSELRREARLPLQSLRSRR